MMLRLARPLRSSHVQGELPLSFFLRTAHELGVPAGEFAKHMGTTLGRIANVDPDAVAALAMATGVDVGTLHRHSLERTSKLKFRFNDQIIDAGMVWLSTVSICPVCMAEAEHFLLRAEWCIKPITVCPRHNVRLATISFQEIGSSSFVDLVRQKLVKVEPTQPTSLEEHLLDRLRGGDDPTWLRTLPFYALVDLSKKVGAGAIVGSRPGYVRRDARLIADRGFRILVDGEASILDYLRTIDETFARGKKRWAPGEIYGGLYRWLRNRVGDDPSYDDFRELLRAHILDAYPLGPGDHIFGKPVELRRYHSIKTLGEQYGLRPHHLKGLLLAGGLITFEQRQRKSRGLLVPAGAADKLAAAAVRACTRRDAQQVLGATTKQLAVLEDIGMVKKVPADRAGRVRYERQTAEQTKATFMKLATFPPAQLSQPILLGSPTLLKHCTNAKALELVLSEKIRRVSAIYPERGLQGIAIDLEELALFFSEKLHANITFPELERHLRITAGARKALCAAGIFPAIHTVDRRGRQTMVTPHKAFDKFDRRYISEMKLKETVGRTRNWIEDWLRFHGVKPALENSRPKYKFYRRRDVAQVFPSFGSTP